MTDVPTEPGSVAVPLRAVVPAPAAELVADHLLGLGAAAVAESSVGGGLVVLIADPTLVGADPLTELRDAVVAMAGVFVDDAVDVVSITWYEEPDESATWTEHAEVVDVGRRLRVRPEWLSSSVDLADRVEVVVAASDAFGSGAHPTTRMCLEAVEQLLDTGDRVLDVGSGSGVLAVAAALLGAESVRCFDVEPAAVAATTRSAEMSGVAGHVAVQLDAVDEIDDLGRYDLVLANLLIPIIEDLAPTLVSAVGPGGHLVVSGVLAGQRERAVAACAPLEIVDEFHDGDWVALVLGEPTGV